MQHMNPVMGLSYHTKTSVQFHACSAGKQKKAKGTAIIGKPLEYFCYHAACNPLVTALLYRYAENAGQ